MLADKVRDLGFNGLSQQNTRPIAQDFGELVADVSWLNQFDDVIFGHGISLLQWRSGGVKHPHDMPPFRFLPSPTFGDSSQPASQENTHGGQESGLRCLCNRGREAARFAERSVSSSARSLRVHRYVG